MDKIKNIDIMNIEELEAALEVAKMKQYQEELAEKYNVRPTQGGGWYTRINGVKCEYRSRDKLINKIMEFEKVQAERTPTPEEMWERFLQQRKLRCSEQTVHKDIRYKDFYISKFYIWTVPIDKITKTDAFQFFEFCKGEKDGAFREKYWWQIQATCKALWDFFVEEGLAETNIFKNMKVHKDQFDEKLYTPEEDTVFSQIEAEKIKQFAILDSKQKGSAIPMAILLFFALGLRVGEMCGLQWRDIITAPNGNKFLHIQREVVPITGGNKLLPHTKTKAGNRLLPLNTYCLNVLSNIRRLNATNNISVFNNDFIFQRVKKGEPTFCNVRVYDSRFRKYCRAAGMTKAKSCHDARRTCITTMYDNGTPVKQLQYFAGHETITQTLEYVRRTQDANIMDFMEDETSLLNQLTAEPPKLTNAS